MAELSAQSLNQYLQRQHKMSQVGRNRCSICDDNSTFLAAVISRSWLAENGEHRSPHRGEETELGFFSPVFDVVMKNGHHITGILLPLNLLRAREWIQGMFPWYIFPRSAPDSLADRSLLSVIHPHAVLSPNLPTANMKFFRQPLVFWSSN